MLRRRTDDSILSGVRRMLAGTCPVSQMRFSSTLRPLALPSRNAGAAVVDTAITTPTATVATMIEGTSPSTVPDCPHCGCNVSSFVATAIRYGRSRAKYECDYCHRQFYLTSVNGRLCKHCGSEKVHIASSPRAMKTSNGRSVKIRYCRCLTCDRTFKSID